MSLKRAAPDYEAPIRHELLSNHNIPWLSLFIYTEHRGVSSVCTSAPIVTIMAKNNEQLRVLQLLPRG